VYSVPTNMGTAVPSTPRRQSSALILGDLRDLLLTTVADLPPWLLLVRLTWHGRTSSLFAKPSGSVLQT